MSTVTIEFPHRYLANAFAIWADMSHLLDAFEESLEYENAIGLGAPELTDQEVEMDSDDLNPDHSIRFTI
jgi:hypothetical protein